MIRADFYTSIVLMLLGLATAVESWRMPRYGDVGSDIWSAPGIVPGLLGVALILMAFVLFMRTLPAIRAGAESEPGEPGAVRRVVTVLVLCIVYAGILVSRVPFWLASFLFVFAFIATFELTDADARSRWMRHVAFALVIAALTSAVVSYIFQNVFFVRLP